MKDKDETIDKLLNKHINFNMSNQDKFGDFSINMHGFLTDLKKEMCDE